MAYKKTEATLKGVHIAYRRGSSKSKELLAFIYPDLNENVNLFEYENIVTREGELSIHILRVHNGYVVEEWDIPIEKVYSATNTALQVNVKNLPTHFLDRIGFFTTKSEDK